MKTNFMYAALGAAFTLCLFTIWAFKPSEKNCKFFPSLVLTIKCPHFN